MGVKVTRLRVLVLKFNRKIIVIIITGTSIICLCFLDACRVGFSSSSLCLKIYFHRNNINHPLFIHYCHHFCKQIHLRSYEIRAFYQFSMFSPQTKQKSVAFGDVLKKANFSGKVFFQFWREYRQAAKLAFVSLDLHTMVELLHKSTEELKRAFFFQFKKKDELSYSIFSCRNRFCAALNQKSENEEKEAFQKTFSLCKYCTDKIRCDFKIDPSADCISDEIASFLKDQ